MDELTSRKNKKPQEPANEQYNRDQVKHITSLNVNLNSLLYFLLNKEINRS
jgi:hypothetical protein